MMMIRTVLLTGLLAACGSGDEGSSADATGADDGSTQRRYCDDRDCPRDLAEALEPVRACEEAFESGMVVEFDDGTVCVGWFDGLGGFGTCYAQGELSGGISYTDIVVEGESSSSGFGDVPLCVSIEPEAADELGCDPVPVSRCLSCGILENEEQTCDEEYLQQLPEVASEG